MTYVPLGQPRFSIITAPSGDAIRIRAPRNLPVMAFMSVWLAGWTFGGFMAVTDLLSPVMALQSSGTQAFLWFWMCGWALAWVFVARTLLWMFFGSETIAIVNGDLQISRRALWFSRTRLFRGTDIRQWSRPPTSTWPNSRNNIASPLGFNIQNGAIRFTYGSRSYDLAAGMDDAEARQILDWVQNRLPAKGHTS